MKDKTRKKKIKKGKKKRTYKKRHYSSNEGMLTTVWGPPMWHVLHTISFNYPTNPTAKEKRDYRKFIINLKNILPCKYCRENLKKNFKKLPLTDKDLKDRNSFSRWVFKLHELINTMLGKKSGLKYCDVRDRYENFRSRCTEKTKKYPTKRIKLYLRRTRKKKEKGCTEPLYGEKSKCIVKIVPKKNKSKTFQMDKKCVKKLG